MKKLLVFLMVFVSGAGCRNEGAVSRVLEQAEDLMIGRPDSALLLLGEIDPAALARVRERTLARYSLLYSQALDKNYIDLTSDSIIRRAVNYYRKHGTPVQKGKAYFYLGRIYANAGKTEASVKAFIRAEHYLETSGDTRMKAQIYGVMGNLLYKQYSFREALEYYDKSLEGYKEVRDLKNTGVLYGAKGLGYSMLTESDSSISNFRNACRIFRELKDTLRVLDMSRKLASEEFVLTRNADSARSILFQTYDTYNVQRYPFEDYSLLCCIYLSKNELDSAAFYAQRMRRYARGLNPAQLKGLYTILSRIHECRNEFGDALYYKKKCADLSDSLYRIEKETIIQNVGQKYRMQQLRESYGVLESRHRTHKAITLLGGSVLLLLSYILYIKWKQVVREKNKEIEENRAFIEKLGSEYTALKLRYEEFSARNSAREDEKVTRFRDALLLRMNVLKKCLDMACLSGKNNDLFLSKFLKMVRLKSDKPYNAISNIIEVADLCNNGISTYMKERYPDLNYEDLCLCSMLSFGFTTDIISIIFNFSHPNSLYNRRFKLRKKLGLSSDINIEKFILDLVEQLGEKNGGRIARPDN